MVELVLSFSVKIITHTTYGDTLSNDLSETLPDLVNKNISLDVKSNFLDLSG
jgi:hypothetical protein